MEKELQELRAQRKRTLASMGVVLTSPTPTEKSRPWSATESEVQTTPRSRRHDVSSSVSAAATNGSKENSDRDLSHPAGEHTVIKPSRNSKDFDRGPKPKRARHRPSFQVSSMDAPQAKEGCSSSGPFTQRASPQHQVLREASSRGNQSPNRRHTMAGLNFPDITDENDGEKGKERRGSLHSLSMTSFDVEGVFSSTQYPPSLSGGQRNAAKAEGDTVAEL
jgi:hypothetical protein